MGELISLKVNKIQENKMQNMYFTLERNFSSWFSNLVKTADPEKYLFDNSFHLSLFENLFDEYASNIKKFNKEKYLNFAHFTLNHSDNNYKVNLDAKFTHSETTISFKINNQVFYKTEIYPFKSNNFHISEIIHAFFSKISEIEGHYVLVNNNGDLGITDQERKLFLLNR